METIPGDLRAKRATLQGASADQMAAWIAAGQGFAVKLVPGKLLLIPSGFIIGMCASKDYEGLRWAVSSDEQDSDRVKRSLTVLLEAFPELQHPSKGKLQLRNYLDTMPPMG